MTVCDDSLLSHKVNDQMSRIKTITIMLNSDKSLCFISASTAVGMIYSLPLKNLAFFTIHLCILTLPLVYFYNFL